MAEPNNEAPTGKYAGFTPYGAYRAALVDGKIPAALANIKVDVCGKDHALREQAISLLEKLAKDRPEHADDVRNLMHEALQENISPEARTDILKSPLVNQKPKESKPSTPAAPADAAHDATPTTHERAPHLQHIKKTTLGAISSDDKFLISEIQTKLQADHKNLGKTGVDGFVTSKHEPSKTVQAWNSEQTGDDPKVNSADLMMATRMAFKKLSSLQITKEQIIESKGEILSDTTKAFLAEAAKEQKKITDVPLAAVDIHPGATPAQPAPKDRQR